MTTCGVPCPFGETVAADSVVRTTVFRGVDGPSLAPSWNEVLAREADLHPSLRPEWLRVLQEGLRHEPFYIVAQVDGRARGVLPLAFVRSRFFGSFLVGLPYLNLGGVLATDEGAATALIDRAVELADELDVHYLELRHERRWSHSALTQELTSKVHMRLALAGKAGDLWDALSSKVRSQVRKATKNGVTICWGQEDLLSDFYEVFSRNMRDLGTPVFSPRLFQSMMRHFGHDAEVCIARCGRHAVAGGVLIHGRGVCDVPSASSLRSCNHLNGNMLLYWSLLERAMERGQRVFDFGRCSVDSPTFKFKRQWGAVPHPTTWQYYVRHGNPQAMRPDNLRNQRRIATWKRLPVWLTRLIGPSIVRGIP
jgi:FemAB-related protein (PEP-CTERM system-associated)